MSTTISNRSAAVTQPRTERSAADETTRTNEAATHTVKRGESLWKIWKAKGAGVSWEDFRKLNPKLGDRVLPGQQVKLPAAAQAAESTEPQGWVARAQGTVPATPPSDAPRPAPPNTGPRDGFETRPTVPSPRPAAPPATPAEAATAPALSPAEKEQFAHQLRSDAAALYQRASELGGVSMDARPQALDAIMEDTSRINNAIRGKLGPNAAAFLKEYPDLQMGPMRGKLTELAMGAKSMTEKALLGLDAAGRAVREVSEKGTKAVQGAQDKVGELTKDSNGVVHFAAGAASAVVGGAAKLVTGLGTLAGTLVEAGGGVDMAKGIAHAVAHPLETRDALSAQMTDAMEKRGADQVMMEVGFNIASGAILSKVAKLRAGAGAAKAGEAAKADAAAGAAANADKAATAGQNAATASQNAATAGQSATTAGQNAATASQNAATAAGGGRNAASASVSERGAGGAQGPSSQAQKGRGPESVAAPAPTPVDVRVAANASAAPPPAEMPAVMRSNRGGRAREAARTPEPAPTPVNVRAAAATPPAPAAPAARTAPPEVQSAPVAKGVAESAKAIDDAVGGLERGNVAGFTREMKSLGYKVEDSGDAVLVSRNGSELLVPKSPRDAGRVARQLREMGEPRGTVSFAAGEEGVALSRGASAEGGIFTRRKPSSELMGNQDSIAMRTDGPHPYIGVADEAGGGGKMIIDGVAVDGGSSKIVLQHIDSAIKKFPADVTPQQAQQLLKEAVQRAHTEIERSGGGAYTTVSAAVRVGDKLVVAQVGDSTVAVVRNGKLIFQTKEDNIGAQLFKQARTAKEQEHALKQANIVNEAVGGPEAPSARVDIVDLQPGDRVLAFSDGLGDAQLARHRSAVRGNELMKEWHGDATLKEAVNALLKQDLTWRERIVEIFKVLTRKTNGVMRSTEDSMKQLRSLVDHFVERGWAKPDDVSFGVIDFK